MKGFSLQQRKILSEFFSTIAAGWFGAGVISTVFIRPKNSVDIIINVGTGLLFAYISLQFALSLAKGEK